MYAHFGEFGAAGPIAHADIFATARGSKSRLRITRGSRGLKRILSDDFRETVWRETESVAQQFGYAPGADALR
jgi:hypothetical protein